MESRWPLGIAAALGVVLLVNLAVAWYAFSNPPELDGTYATEER
jgi:hypothetical protein